MLLTLERSEIAFIVSQRQDREQQQTCGLLRSPPKLQGWCLSTPHKVGYAVVDFSDGAWRSAGAGGVPC